MNRRNRPKEELRTGRTLSSAVEAGFSRAWSSIRDSNISTLMTCGILYYFGTSTIRGFALTLALGVIISLFTAITVSRTFLRLLVGTGVAQHPALFGVRVPEAAPTATRRGGLAQPAGV